MKNAKTQRYLSERNFGLWFSYNKLKNNKRILVLGPKTIDSLFMKKNPLKKSK